MGQVGGPLEGPPLTARVSRPALTPSAFRAAEGSVIFKEVTEFIGAAEEISNRNPRIHMRPS